MSGAGRPLRFLLLVGIGWIGARVVLLWPISPAVAIERVIAPGVAAAPPVGAIVLTATGRGPAWPIERGAARRGLAWRGPVAGPLIATPPAPERLLVTMTAPDVLYMDPGYRDAGLIAGLPTAPTSEVSRSRLFGSAWAVVRDGNGPAGGIAGAQLGGSQAGIRLAYALNDSRRLALATRVSAPLGPGMREVAVGVEWQPTRLPLRLIAEQRFALGGGRGGPALLAVGGIGPLPLVAGFDLEGYAQGGLIVRDGREGFADGALRIARRIARPGGVRIDLGAGSWGAAQRGAARLDIGPSLSATMPIGRQAVRLSLDWRQRVAGNAAPGSGLVVTLGADF